MTPFVTTQLDRPDEKAKLKYHWDEGDDITEDIKGTSGIYDATEGGRKQSIDDLKAHGLTTKEAKAKPVYKMKNGHVVPKTASAEEKKEMAWKRDTIFYCADVQHAQNNPSANLCACGWMIQAERDATSYWNIRGWRVIAR